MPVVNQPEPADAQLIELLQRRDGHRTILVLRDGRRLSVINIAWGYDIGDEYAHVTSNISPAVDGESVDFFMTSQVERILNESGEDISER